MSALAPKTTPRDRLRGWLRRHDHDLFERAVTDIEETNALSEALEHNGISTTQLRGLLNTAKVATEDDLSEYVGNRKDRRAAANQDDAAFWRELETLLNGFDDRVDEAVAACGAEETTPQSRRAGQVDRRHVKTQVVRCYLSHFVAHCQYLQTLD